MKVRNGFVSNSSSSSFLVGFPFKLESAKQIHKDLFEGKEEFHCESGTYDAYSVAECIFKEMKPVTDLEKAFKDLDWGYAEGISSEEAQKETGVFWYEGEFEDHFGPSRAIEPWGDPFQNMPYVRFSHH